MKKYSFWFLCIFFILYLGLFSFQQIDLATADLGRHLSNGNIFIHPEIANTQRSILLNTNFFSYTYPNNVFINHHWGSGIIFYILYSLSGFEGLSLFYFLCIAGAIIMIIGAIKDDVDIKTLILCGLFITPLIASRTEVRPEGVSYFFLAFFFFFLYRFSKDKISWKYMFILAATELLWVNMHIYFIFGIFLIGVFLFEAILRKHTEQAKKLSIILVLTSITTLINPYGLRAVTYPFTIFQNYGYRVVENQSIYFLENLSFNNPDFLWYKICLCLVIVSNIFIVIKARKRFSIAPSILTFTFAILGYVGIRHISPFALLSFPLLVHNIYVIEQLYKKKISYDNIIIYYTFLIAFVLIITLIYFFQRLPWNRNFGLGLTPGSLDSITFIQKHNLVGPIFNNYDIGGLAIFALFPREKVFVDNRPEAYPKNFFSDIYIPMQENEVIWNAELKKENFNVIFFYRLDYTPWAQAFLIQRITDPAWAPVFVDNKTIIFLRRTVKNEKIISTFELPKELFTSE